MAQVDYVFSSAHGRYPGRTSGDRLPRGHRRGFVEWRSYVRRYRCPTWPRPVLRDLPV